MKPIAILVFFCCFLGEIDGQNLHLTSWLGYNRTAYNLTGFESAQSYLTYGGLVAFGKEKFMFGAEYETQLTDPSFEIKDQNDIVIQKDQFSTTYYGGLIRFNTAKVPAYRLGLILKAGVGVYDIQKNVFALPDDKLTETITYPNKVLGLNASIGFSAPIYRFFHWELHYQFNYANRPELDNIPSYNAIHHSIRLGLSLNFVFGEAARRSKKVLESKK